MGDNQARTGWPLSIIFADRREGAPGGAAMQDRDSFYYRAIRTKIGDALRAQYDVKEPLPEPLAKILLELDSEGVPVVEADRHKDQ
jgi:hypothetical protein